MADYWVKSGTGGTDAGTSWANAAESITGLLTAQAVAGGDTIYVHNTHNNLAGAAISWTLPEATAGVLKILCVDGGDATGASLVDGTVGSLTTGASESTNGNFALTITSTTNATIYWYGIQLKAGAAANSASADIILGTSVLCNMMFENCKFWIDSTSTSALPSWSAPSSASLRDLVFKNCTFRFGATGQFFDYRGGATFINCSIDSAGSSPSVLFNTAGAPIGNINCIGCDWSLATAVFDQSTAGDLTLFRANNCVIGTPTTGTHAGLVGTTAEFMACSGSTTPDILSYYYEGPTGVVEDSLATAGVYLTTGGAEGKNEDGTATKYSLKMAPVAVVSKYTPLYTPWIYANVASTGDKTVTMKVATATTALKTSEVWMEVEYMGEPGLAGTQRDADSPQTINEVDDDCNIVTGTQNRDPTAAGSNRTDTTEAWSSNNADWAAAVAHTLTASINIAEQGYIRCRVGLAKDQDTYVDPRITVS